MSRIICRLCGVHVWGRRKRANSVCDGCRPKARLGYVQAWRVAHRDQKRKVDRAYQRKKKKKELL